MKIGFIGCGNMAGAMIEGILTKGIVEKEDLTASAKTETTAEKARRKFGIHAGNDNRQAASEEDLLILAVKPVFMEEVIKEIADVVKPQTVVISLAPGKTLKWLREKFGKKVKLVRTMPNTPALVGEGMTALCPNEEVSEEEFRCVEEVFRSFGRTRRVPEKMIDVVTGVSGSSPAFVYMFIEAMADAAVCAGMPRKEAYEFAAQSVLGSAKMVLETGKHPGELKDMVCSPGGTTIEGVRVMEEKGMRSAVIEAETACIEKARRL